MTKDLNAMVAKHILGWEWDESRCRVCGWPLEDSDDKGCTKDSCSMRPLPEVSASEIPPFNTDIKWAWQVVEAMLQRKYRVLISATVPARYYVEMMRDPAVRSEYIQQYADTAPLAICFAALRAVGVAEAEIQKAMPKPSPFLPHESDPY